MRDVRDTDASPAPVFDVDGDAIHTLMGKVNRLQDSLEGLRAGQDHAFQLLRDAMRKDRVVMGLITLALSLVLVMVLVAVLVLQTGWTS